MRRPRLPGWIVALCGVGAVAYFVPLFHVVPLEAARQQETAATFDAARYVEEFWEQELPEAMEQAVAAPELLAALREDTARAAERFGRRPGLGGSAFYFVSGQGRVTANDGRSIAIEVADNEAAVVIETGPVFGNAVRDGSGAVNVSDFANAQDFNAVSTEINRRIESRVLPLLEAQAGVGRQIRFVGGAELRASVQDSPSLLLVPVRIEFP